MGNNSKNNNYSQECEFYSADHFYIVFFIFALYFVGQWIIKPDTYDLILASWLILCIATSFRGIEIDLKEWSADWSIASLKKLKNNGPNQKIRIFIVPLGICFGMMIGLILGIFIPKLCFSLGISELKEIVIAGSVIGAALGYFEGGKKFLKETDAIGNINNLFALVGSAIGAVAGFLLGYGLVSLYSSIGLAYVAYMAAFGGITGAIFGYLEVIRIYAKKIGRENGAGLTISLFGVAVGAVVGSLLGYGIYSAYIIYTREAVAGDITIIGVLGAVLGCNRGINYAKKHGWTKKICLLTGLIGLAVFTIAVPFIYYRFYL